MVTATVVYKISLHTSIPYYYYRGFSRFGYQKILTLLTGLIQNQITYLPPMKYYLRKIQIIYQIVVEKQSHSLRYLADKQIQIQITFSTKVDFNAVSGQKMLDQVSVKVESQQEGEVSCSNPQVFYHVHSSQSPLQLYSHLGQVINSKLVQLQLFDYLVRTQAFNVNNTNFVRVTHEIFYKDELQMGKC